MAISNEGKLKRIRDDLNEILECGICKSVFDDPRMLPCVHSFCLKCLMQSFCGTDAVPEGELRCPVCRREFTAPEDGLPGLQKNFFLTRLTETMQFVNSDPADNECDACRESQTPGDVTPSAVTFCTDCKEKLCSECSVYHRKKQHKLVTVGDPDSGDDILASIPSSCRHHKRFPMDMYCEKCCEVLCPRCYIEKHEGHEKRLVDDASKKFRKQIQDSVSALLKRRESFGKQHELLQEKKMSVLEKTTELENGIIAAKEEVKNLVDKCTERLIHALSLAKQKELKEIATLTDSVNFKLACIDNYLLFCRGISCEGSDADICRAGQWLEARSLELQELEMITVTRMSSLQRKVFRKTPLEEILSAHNLPVVGSLEDEAEESRSEQSVLDPMCVNKEHRCHVLSSSKPEQRISSTSCADPNDAVRQSPDGPLEKQDDEICSRKSRNSESELGNVLKSEKVEPSMKRSLSEAGQQMKEENTAASHEPFYLQMIKTKISETASREIQGLTILGGELFVASDQSSEIEVYDSTTFEYIRQLCIAGLVDPGDMVACGKNNCLYIIDWKNRAQANRVMRTSLTGEVMKSWTTPNDYSWISVTRDGNLVLTLLEGNKINEYQPDGSLVLSVKISRKAQVDNLWYAMKQSKDHFLISHGRKNLCRVCRIDLEGNVLNSFCDSSEEQRLKSPVYFAEEWGGSILVVDQNRRRVVQLSSTLEFQKVYTTRRHKLSSPRRICLCDSRGLAFVADEHGKVLVFSVKCQF